MITVKQRAISGAVNGTVDMRGFVTDVVQQSS